jgi:hypothetical protein
VRAKIVDKNGSDLTNTDEYSVCNYLLHSMFSQVDLLINNQSVTDGNNCYGYKAFIQSIISNGQDYFLSQAQTSLFFLKINLELLLQIQDTSFEKRTFRDRKYSNCVISLRLHCT